MTSVADYAERTADILAFRGMFPAPAGLDQLLAQELVSTNDGGALVTGIEKLAQKVLITLLTKLGSKLLQPNDGCLFMLDAQQGQWRTPADVIQSFYGARLTVRRQIQAEELTTDPADERWGDLLLVSVTLSAGKAALTLQLTSLAGSAYTFITPITVPIQ